MESDYNSMQAIAKADIASIPAGKSFRIRAMLKLTAPGLKEKNTGETTDTKRNTPLNIALVLDRSGSMQGEKLKYVKRAASMLVSRLRSHDIVSVTVFDDKVNTIVLPAPVDKSPQIETAINSIEAGGSTDLAAGYAQGAKYAAQNDGANLTSRILLLTDGLANKGITNHSAIAARAKQYAESGVTTTTIGVGEGYNEELLARIAGQGGGNFYYVEKPEDAPDVFDEELGYLYALWATDVHVRFAPSDGRISASQLNNYLRIDGSGYLLGEMYSGQSKYLLIEAELPPVKEPGPLTIGSFIIDYSIVLGDQELWETLTVPLKLNVISADQMREVAPDREVLLQSAYLYLAREKEKAIRAADEGKYDESARILTDCA